MRTSFSSHQSTGWFFLSPSFCARYFSVLFYARVSVYRRRQWLCAFGLGHHFVHFAIVTLSACSFFMIILILLFIYVYLLVRCKYWQSIIPTFIYFYFFFARELRDMPKDALSANSKNEMAVSKMLLMHGDKTADRKWCTCSQLTLMLNFSKRNSVVGTPLVAARVRSSKILFQWFLMTIGLAATSRPNRWIVASSHCDVVSINCSAAIGVCDAHRRFSVG